VPDLNIVLDSDKLPELRRQLEMYPQTCDDCDLERSLQVSKSILEHQAKHVEGSGSHGTDGLVI
jgi:hypothetical protein